MGLALVTTNDLDQLTETIRSQHAACQTSAIEMVERMVECG